jgi:hypothetical protein
MLKKWVLLYSRSQKFYHTEQFGDYIEANVKYPHQDYRLISPLFETRESLNEWHEENRRKFDFVFKSQEKKI